MKICFVHEEYPEETNFGGIATYQKIMAEELAKQGHEVYVICRGLRDNKFYIEKKVNIYRIFVEKTDNQKRDYINYRRKVAEILIELQQKNKIDIIETPDWGAETILFEEYRQVPLVVRLHTPLKIWLKYNKNDFGDITKTMLKWEKMLISKADLVTCCSDILKQKIVDEFKVDSDSILVTPNPANIKDFYRIENVKKQNKIIFVGSLEERKGVIVLAKALNIVFKKYPELKMEYVGKDTNRNSKNISTKELISSIIDNKYSRNILFRFQIQNKDLNLYLNESLLGVFPSLFDNFPYVVLESMATGLFVVGSQNSGMVDMLDDMSCIYKTGDYKDLASKIINIYELASKQKINDRNIYRINNLYNSKKVCKEMLSYYKKTIVKYNKRRLNDFHKILKNIDKTKVDSYKNVNKNLANSVFIVTTKNNKKYAVKKYKHKYNFGIQKNIYDKYLKEGLNCVHPLNEKIIEYGQYKYNVFEYISGTDKEDIDIEFFSKILLCNRETKHNETIIKKCNKYYNKILSVDDYKDLSADHVKYVVNVYSSICNNPLFKEKYYNHGDISKTNLIETNSKIYIIDFDETCVGTRLYDFAVIVIKFFIKDKKINFRYYEKLKKILKNEYKCYKDTDFLLAIKFYLCKILLEKFYLHLEEKIDVFDSQQLKDDYRFYLYILKNL